MADIKIYGKLAVASGSVLASSAEIQDTGYKGGAKMQSTINNELYDNTQKKATSSTLGMVMVGAGLTVSDTGLLSATGGGTADSVAWNNVVGRPQFGYTTDTTNKKYAVKQDGLNMYVEVPWADTITTFQPTNSADLPLQLFNVKCVGDGKITFMYGDPTNPKQVVFTNTDTTYGVATSTTNGLMSSTDKAKLDGLGVAFKGATSTVDGSIGMVPAPAKGLQSTYLRGDGTWAAVPVHITKFNNKTLNSIDTLANGLTFTTIGDNLSTESTTLDFSTPAATNDEVLTELNKLS